MRSEEILTDAQADIKTLEEMGLNLRAFGRLGLEGLFAHAIEGNNDEV